MTLSLRDNRRQVIDEIGQNFRLTPRFVEKPNRVYVYD